MFWFLIIFTVYICGNKLKKATLKESNKQFKIKGEQ